MWFGIGERHSPPSIILCFHSLYDEKMTDVPPTGGIEQAQFEEMLEWLSGFVKFVPLGELMFKETTKDLQWRVAITFDDGHRDNLEIASPLLEKYRIPMTWFVATEFIENPQRLPWWILLREARDQYHGPLRIVFEDEVLRFDLSTESGRATFSKNLKNRFINLEPDSSDRLYRGLLQELRTKVELPDNDFARSKEVRRASRTPWIEIGGHTRSHPNLACCSMADLHTEIRGGRERLQEMTGQSVRWFAYPFGRESHWNEQVIQAVREAGYAGAVTLVPGYVNDRTDRYKVPRVAVQPEWTMKAFKFRVLHANVYRSAQRLKRTIQVTRSV